ncbi:IS630 family transposase [Streptosporangium sp. NPDC001559]|uniref:IS630 family transposase n=1 Tax=Streptosporangium sp. NPDC001559 TaxID=3366187 RepID=UPI0036EDA6D8
MTSISRGHLTRILKAGKVSWQSTTTWKNSNDTDFVAKMQRVLALYDTPPKDGRVICVDEFGPLNLQPRKGKAWRPGKNPRRLRATYNRYSGAMHLLGALDLATGKIYHRIRERKRWREFLAFVKSLRERWPGGTLHLIVDNYSLHKHPQVKAWAAANDIELVFLPTYASWLNWIESEFAALRYFALNGTDHRSHPEQNAAIAAHVRWHNQHAHPKASSPIRGPVIPPRLRDAPLDRLDGPSHHAVASRPPADRAMPRPPGRASVSQRRRSLEYGLCSSTSPLTQVNSDASDALLNAHSPSDYPRCP